MKQAMTVVAVVLLAAGAAWAGDYTETFDQTYALDQGGRVGIENINGDVTIEVWDQAEVRVYAVKQASTPERLEALKIEVDASSRGVFIDTHYPNSRDLGFADRHGHSEVEYTLTVPRFASIDGVDLVNGDLLIDGVEGDIEADTVNGTIVVRGAGGEIELDTVNGGIELRARVDREPRCHAGFGQRDHRGLSDRGRRDSGGDRQRSNQQRFRDRGQKGQVRRIFHEREHRRRWPCGRNRDRQRRHQGGIELITRTVGAFFS